MTRTQTLGVIAAVLTGAIHALLEHAHDQAARMSHWKC